jgi:hypothetical protein
VRFLRPLSFSLAVMAAAAALPAGGAPRVRASSPAFERLEAQRGFPAVKAQTVRDDARRILSDRIFQPPTQDPNNLLLGKVAAFFGKLWAPLGNALQRIVNWFAQRLKGIGIGSGAADMLLTLVLVLLGTTLVAGVLWALMRSRRAPSAPVELQEDAPVPEDTAPEQLMRHARELAASGEFRGAVRAAYAASLLQLDRARLVRYDANRTNWEYLRMLKRGGHADAESLLRPVTGRFDYVWYGERTAGPEDFRIFEDTFANLLRTAPAVEA